MKLWIDDVRPAPEGYVWCKSTNETLRTIRKHCNDITEINLDHDAGDYAESGGDFINVLNELERLSRKRNIVDGVPLHNYWRLHCQEIRFKLHSMNPVGVENMRRIIKRNGWTEI